jgi:hypothetical protein
VWKGTAYGSWDQLTRAWDEAMLDLNSALAEIKGRVGDSGGLYDPYPAEQTSNGWCSRRSATPPPPCRRCAAASAARCRADREDRGGADRPRRPGGGPQWTPTVTRSGERSGAFPPTPSTETVLQGVLRS